MAKDVVHMEGLRARGQKGYKSASQSHRMRGVDKAKAPRHQGKGKMGSVVRHVDEDTTKARSGHGGRTFTFGSNW